MLSITGCKSDVQKAAEDYYSTVYLPKIQAEYGNESVVERARYGAKEVIVFPIIDLQTHYLHQL